MSLNKYTSNNDPTLVAVSNTDGETPVYLYAILASSTTCADLARYSIRDIPHGDPHYKLYLDRDKDRVACES